MSVKIFDTMTTATPNFPLAYAEKINIVKEDGSEADIQTLYNNGDLGSKSTAITISQEEFDALDEQTKLENDYRCYDTGRLYYKGVRYGHDEPETIEGFSKFKEMKEAGLIDDEEEYIVSADENGILLEASDIGYSNAVSNLPCTTVQGAIDKVNDKVDNLIDDEVSDSTVWSSKKTSDEIEKHSLPLVYDSGAIGNSTVEYYKLSNVNVGKVNLLLSTRFGDEVELSIGTTANNQYIQAKNNFNYSNKISGIHMDGTDLYVTMNTYFDYLRIYHKNGALRSDFAVTKVTSIPDTATEIPITTPGVMDDLTSTESTWSSSKINSKLGGLSFSASGTTLTITNGTNTWTLVANS